MKSPPATNPEIRDWYLSQLAKISNVDEKLKAEGVSLKKRAVRACQARHDARIMARSFMTDPEDVEILRRRDQEKYGSSDGPTFEMMAKQLQQKDLSENEVLERIIQAASRSDREINRLLGF